MALAGAITANDIINEALGHLQVFTGDPLSASDLQSAFFTLRAIIDGYALEDLLKFETQSLPFTLTPGKQSYTLGTAAGSGVDWVAPFLPTGYESVTLQWGTLELPVALDTFDQWSSIAIKSLSSTITSEMYADVSPASHVLSFYPVPTLALPIVLYVRQQVAALASTSTAVVLPPGYLELLVFELAIKCSSKFGADIPSWIPVAWADAKSKIKATNYEALDLFCDPALVKRGSRLGGGSLAFYKGD